LISEHQFANHYSSAWRAITPLSDGFWTFENLQVERIAPPLHGRAPKEVRAILNEASFRAFCELQPTANAVGRVEVLAALDSNLQAAIDYVARFSNSSELAADIDEDSRKEAVSLVFRLLHFFPTDARTILKPKFNGCGILSSCEGDLIAGSCLYEIKAGDRGFRVLDLRQLLTYSALAYASESLAFTEIGLFNPRTGVAWRRSLEEVCLAISGLRMTDTLSALVEQFTGASASR
jgi:hypothetical protein